MLKAFVYEPSEGRLLEGGEELLDRWASQENSLLWLRLVDEPPEQEAKLLHRRFGLHRLAISDAQRVSHPPKIERFAEYVFLLFKVLTEEKEDLEFGTSQLALFVSSRFMISRQSCACPTVDGFEADLRRKPEILAEGIFPAALHLVRPVLDAYLPILQALEPRLDDIEDEMREKPNDALLEELTGYRIRLKKLGRIAVYHLKIFQPQGSIAMTGFASWQHELNDIYEHLDRTDTLCTLYHGLAQDLIDGYISMSAHRLNEIMKLLTVITAIFVPLSFLAGVYGMNFDHMPELHVAWGYPLLLGTMAAIAAGLLFVFRRFRWI
jgi:magnesium transporter